jgi:hypothetical protein
LGLLLLAAPGAAQAQFYYSENPNVGFSNNAVTITITGYYGPDGNVSIPATIDGLTVTGIGQDAFYECIGVTNVTIPGSVTSIGDGAFYASGLSGVTIPGNVTSIGVLAFENCASLTNATIADGVVSIGASAFESCASLASLTIPGSVLSIGPYAFSYCTGLTNATISDGLISIGDAAFSDCSKLTSVTIPGSVTSVGEDAFHDCVRLTAITVDAQNSVYSSVDGVLYDKSVASLVEAPTVLDGSFTIPGSVTSIGENAFSDCGVTEVTILNGVTSIGDGAFNGCAYLTSIALPGSITSIGAYAFYNCNDLTSLTIPGSVTSIGAYAFSACARLTDVYFGGDAPPADSTVFIGDTIPFGSVTNYYLPGTTGWSFTFAGEPTALWRLPYPVILNNGPSFGVQSNAFGFTISWATNISVVVEASANLAGGIWTPLQTNTLTNGSFYFNEPLHSNSPGRFYRVSSR